MTRLTILIASLAICLQIGLGEAQAVPILQLYLEGGIYNPDTESWTLAPPGSSAGDPFRLWAIGNIDGPGGKGPISDVRLAVAYDLSDVGLDISFTPSQAGGLNSAEPGIGEFNGIEDPSVPGTPTLNTTVLTSLGLVNTESSDGLVYNGGTPVLGTGKNLPAHGVYGADTVWQEYLLGDFSTPDSLVGDFIGSFPTELKPGGQINVYDVSVTGGSGATIHFDLYNTVKGGTGAVFAPFSHDADSDTTIIPEPSSVAVWSLLGLVGVAASRRRPRRQ